jgi:hypothetical protein
MDQPSDWVAAVTQGPPGCHVIPARSVAALVFMSGATKSSMNAIKTGNGSGAMAIVVRFKNARHWDCFPVSFEKVLVSATGRPCGNDVLRRSKVAAYQS